jgi:hypothetical protein
MLSASSFYTNALNSTVRNFNIKAQLTRNTSGAVPIDISDRVVSYNTTHDYESRGGRMDLVIDNYDYTYSPQNRTSSINQVGGVYDPILDSNHKIELFEGILESNGSYEYIKKFEAYVGDDISASSLSPQIQLSCRDKSKLLQDKYIYQSPTYALFLVEQVIQDMLNTFAPELGITLSVQTPTMFMIGRPTQPYTASDTNLWDACQLLADTASQELRFMEDGTLLLRPVIRDWTTLPVSMTLDESSLTDDESQITDADVRNYIVVKVQNFSPVIAQDASSIAKYGRRYMEVSRSITDLITDASQAVALANNILWDLKFARPNQTSEIPLHPLVQVGDIVQINNPRLGTSSANDIFKVLTVNNGYSKDRKRTKLTLQEYDKFLANSGNATNPPTALSFQMQTRSIQNYPNSGWNGYQKNTYFPMLQWTPPTKDVSGNTLASNFGGYVIERATQLSANAPTSGSSITAGNTIVSNWTWTTIASIPSYINSLGINVNYFYDYSSASVLDQYKQAGTTGNSINLQYRVTAITMQGAKSTTTSPITVNLSYPRYQDISGNYL